MEHQKNYIELVRQAQDGDSDSLERLAEMSRGRLYAYVYRIVLRHDAAQEIVQESMLAMVKFLGKLDGGEGFWPWLRGIASNKIRDHRADKQRHKAVSMSSIGEPTDPGQGEQGISRLIADEVRALVLAAMRELTPAQRKVLTMRCYEEMPYSEIGQLTGRSEFGARVTFYRAKRTLRKALSRKGMGGGFMLTSLVLFGKMTATSKAAAAEVSVSAASMKVGAAAAVLGTAASKTVVLSLAAAGAVAVGTVVVTTGPNPPTAGANQPMGAAPGVSGLVSTERGAFDELWYYFPEGGKGPVMMRAMASDGAGGRSYCFWRQNEQANYYYDRGKNTCYIRNCRYWRPDLAVARLPTDRVEMTDFLAEVEGPRRRMEYIAGNASGLLVIARPDGDGEGIGTEIIRHQYLLQEEYFRYDWPPHVRVVDERDAMHRRRWTYFTVEGRVNEERISGAGRIPFVYAQSRIHSPWLRARIGDRLEFADNGREAVVCDGSGRIAASYRGGSFFVGLARPWTGLHTIDVVRRDAAEQRVRFETEYTEGEEKAKVILSLEAAKLIYTINLQKDIIEKIDFAGSDGAEGEMRFTYLQEIEELSGDFAEPEVRRTLPGRRKAGPGVMWLMKLFSGS